MNVTPDFDIAIIGDGMTGLSAAYHLQKLGFTRLCVFSRTPAVSSTMNACGMLVGGLADNYTRISHQHGRNIAKSLWTFANDAYDDLYNYCLQHKIHIHNAQKIRWINSTAEAIEAQMAIKLLQDDGFQASWQDPTATGHSRLLNPHLAGTQLEDGRASVINLSQLIQNLRRTLPENVFPSAVLELKNESNGILIRHQSGITRVEIVLCAQHLAMVDVIPELAFSLVAYADQWAEFELVDPYAVWPWPVGTVFSWQYGYQWGVVSSQRQIKLGGARFLRPMAGLEAQSAPYLSKITEYLLNAWLQLWPQWPIQLCTDGKASLDCRPSDELPIIGPMYGQSRILVATGYMGQGLALGFFAGRCLAELIAGHVTSLPRILWPERLRSLPSQQDRK